jgi:hypothetical protein
VHVVAAVFYPGWAHVLDPHQIVVRLAEAFVRDGGTIERVAVRRLAAEGSRITTLVTEAGDRAAGTMHVPPLQLSPGWQGGVERPYDAPVPTAADLVDSSLVEAFRHDGAVCVRGAFSGGEVAVAERGIERNLAVPSERALVASRTDDPGRFFEDFCNWDRIPEFEGFIRASPAAEIAGELMSSTQVRLFHDHLLVKEPGTRQATPWHQDQPYYNIDGADTVSFWIPLDPVPREKAPGEFHHFGGDAFALQIARPLNFRPDDQHMSQATA